MVFRHYTSHRADGKSDGPVLDCSEAALGYGLRGLNPLLLPRSTVLEYMSPYLAGGIVLPIAIFDSEHEERQHQAATLVWRPSHCFSYEILRKARLPDGVVVLWEITCERDKKRRLCCHRCGEDDQLTVSDWVDKQISRSFLRGEMMARNNEVKFDTYLFCS